MLAAAFTTSRKAPLFCVIAPEHVHVSSNPPVLVIIFMASLFSLLYLLMMISRQVVGVAFQIKVFLQKQIQIIQHASYSPNRLYYLTY